jgi:hypothetical protein
MEYIFVAAAGALVGWALHAMGEMASNRARRRYLDDLDGALMTREELLASNHKRHTGGWNG